ncbi:alpha-ketoglutarate dehydrogenase [Herbaspirillum seropedicae]|uniref:Pyruvate dehydrogenase E1 component n=2 Tax=Herbaspirillum seropedicae TaxID=964 RepID=D8ISN3_HERSS|nr:alpha-ketoglutarate dehydrogenase [Herbaspirillum seropedicae]ADJ65449.1 pyruvate dehydrogenase E1 component protein [Herbaspirillum seropedicae SmR1]AKN67284.1 pyruvate dehydrogenase [Herbaspirillum seropedicae]NQE31862.1 pyruvate dehydrogenase [Herbaspirillum seropedicae]UMU23291.1 alpha-ketoglutarate dehydrogenase [Herbaspirillum seropedicae]
MSRPSDSDIARDIDIDSQETQEWLQALQSVLAEAGPERARFLLSRLSAAAQQWGVNWRDARNTPYVNTIRPEQEPPFPGGSDAQAIEERIASIMRWNALAMVVRANRAYGELGGHIASFASAADLFEVGFNHFFRARDEQFAGDVVYFQPHSAPGIYARAFLEGALSEDDLAYYRREIEAKRVGRQGLSSYPHPWLMPQFWQFPTGSMGIGPINAIYQARFLRYMEHRGLLQDQGRKVWGVFGDGEMDEPESLAALSLASREKLDNLIFVVNCNLQRLDGPVRGNGHIVDELETLFAGAGWNVIKLLWGSDWDGLFARDKDGELVDALNRTVDGQLQTFAANDGAFNRQHFFGQTPGTRAIGATLTDEEINRLRRGGHDMKKIYSAYQAAARHRGQPTVILAQTKKGYGMGAAGEGKMTTHQQKKLDEESLLQFRDRFKLPLSDEQCRALAFYKPADDSPEMKHLHARRAALSGYLPRRQAGQARRAVPPLAAHSKFALEADGKEMSSTMALVRQLGNLLKDKDFGQYVVPIVADEARTFGMANLFRQVGIYSSQGQLYEPEDIGSILYYREAKDGQILEEGITEAGAISSWTAAATAYSVHGTPMLPFYIYYSMFGFQRIGDLIWAAADQRARGFLIGATSGRTTLGGEGLQHQDGNSLVTAASIPNCVSYDPAYAYELAVILDEGMRRMMERGDDVFYYITVTNENEAQPSLPEGVQDGILRGLYCLARKPQAQARLLGSGPILKEAVAAAALLQQHWQIEAEVWSVTSYTELARDGVAAQRAQRLAGSAALPYVTQQLQGSAVPVIAVSDYIRTLPESIRAFVPAPYVTLGTDGFGRSDTRVNLRDFFEIDARWIAYTALCEVWGDDRARLQEAARTLGIDTAKPLSSTV